MPYGRPMKGASRRVPTTVHIPTGTLDIIDNYIDDREKDVETGRMSRSDFINEAVNRYLVELGLVEPESNTEVTPKEHPSNRSTQKPTRTEEIQEIQALERIENNQCEQKTTAHHRARVICKP